MAAEADNVVEAPIEGEGPVAAFVGQDPESCADKPLEETVASPSYVTKDEVLDGGDIDDGSPGEPNDASDITSQIPH